jgi:hypothetical protein
MTSSVGNLLVDEHAVVHTDATVQDELASIVRPYHEMQRPVVVRGAVSAAPATTLWTDWDYWQTTTTLEDNDENETVVAVEMGGPYGSARSERAEIPMVGYLQYLKLFEEQHGRTGDVSRLSSRQSNHQESPRSSWDIPSKDLVYMAQNDLPRQLYKDVMIPDFCQKTSGTDASESSTTGSGLGLGRLYSVMLWLGPRGCVSPLHFDPLDNCLMQHVGRKRVLLFEATTTTSSSSSPSVVGWHHAGLDGQQTNTSPIDPEILDRPDGAELRTLREQYPLFFGEGRPPRLECVLEPGDLLYIPARWWHHVRSIDTSASVNVWWR